MEGFIFEMQCNQSKDQSLVKNITEALWVRELTWMHSDRIQQFIHLSVGHCQKTRRKNVA